MARHVERYDWAPNPRRPPDLSAWPYTIPAVKQLIDEGGLELADGVTFLVGENGSGKSTLVEALASLRRRGVESAMAPHAVGPGGSHEDSPLGGDLKARMHARGSVAGFFLRAEAMHAFLTEVDASEGEARAWGAEKMQARSHGESFLAVLRHRFTDVGIYFLDEPEAALSFRSCLGLIALLDTMRREGSQIVIATHSPLLVSLPGATLLELGDWGIRKAARYDDLALVQDFRHFLSAPGRFLKHLVGDDPAG